jgi:membrane protease YdiL (CAAX protease family)
LIPSDPPASDPTEPAPGPPTETPPPARPGAGTFTIEGRAAPALFVVGWLATLIGFVAIFVALLAGGSVARVVILVLGLILLSVGLIAGAGSQAIERRARATGAYGGPSPLLVFAASIPLTILASAAVGLGLSVLGISVQSPLAAVAAVSIQALIYLGLIRLLVIDAGALRWAEMGVRRFDRRALGELAGGALWALPVIFATALLVALITRFVPVTPESPLPPTGTIPGFLLNLLAGALIAPIGEELFFRGFAMTAWLPDIGERRSLIRVALFFAAAHVLTIAGSTADQAVALAFVAFASRIPVALALGWLFLKRRSIWAPIGLHATFNGILLTIAEIAARGGFQS